MTDEPPIPRHLIAAAIEFRRKHHGRVRRQMAGCKQAEEPLGSVRRRPDLWRPPHWVWLEKQENTDA